jgi:hypothetical protein
MSLFYPSFDALRLADTMVGAIGEQTPGYQGRVGASWYWRLPAGILAVAHLDHTVTEERWDVLRAEASTPRAGIFSRANFPFAVYATSATSPPFIHDLKGVAEWSNRLYFQMGGLIEDAVHWLGMLHAVAISPQVSPPSAFPALSPLERRLVRYAMEELEGAFNLKALHGTFKDEISNSKLRRLAQTWEAKELLTSRPRRVTYALQVLVEE